MSKPATYVDFRALKESVTILQILDRYGITPNLTGTGDSRSGACPICGGENKTKFRVSISKNCWNCFGGCGGGNAIDFVAKKEGISFREAAGRVKEWFNVDAPAAPPSKKKSPRKDKTKPPPAEQGREEPKLPQENKPLGFTLSHLDPAHPCLKERGLDAATIQEFGLGFCSKGIMNGRIAIPIHNASGALIAYAGRWPGDPPEGTPKYKLPKGFQKALELFNQHRAAEASTSTPLIVVEGFFVCINVWQAGFRRVVALMGSTLTDRQFELIKALLAPDARIILMFDEDKAGREGREKALTRLAPLAFVKVIVFPEEEQSPDTISLEEISNLLG